MSFPRRLLLACALAISACSSDSTDASRSIIALRFASQPSTVRVDTPFTVTVELLGPDGERATSAADSVSLSVIGPASLIGETTVVPVQGVATFSGLRLTSASESLQLRVTAAGISATSPPFKATDDCAPLTVAFPVVVTGSFANASCFVDGYPTVFYRFTKGEFGPLQIVVSTANPAVVPEITVINDPPSDFIPTPHAGTTTTGNWILPAAPYRLRVRAIVPTAGSFTISTNTAPVAGCVLRTLLPFAQLTVPGRIETGDCAENGKNYDWYQVYSPRPCTVTLRGITAAVDAFISVRNARTHAVVAENDNATGVATMDAFVMLTECRSGTDPIEVFATSSGPGASGDYALTVQITGGVSTFLVGPGTNR